MASTEPRIVTDIVLLGVHEGAHATLLREYRCGPIRMTATPVGSEFIQEAGRLVAGSIEFRGSTDGAKIPAAPLEHIDVRIAGFVAEGATAASLLDPAGRRRTDDMQIALRLARDEVGPDAPDEEVDALVRQRVEPVRAALAKQKAFHDHASATFQELCDVTRQRTADDIESTFQDP